MSALVRTVAIVGGGFSGVSVAINLLRSPAGAAMRIVLIERSGCVGRGAAYAKRAFPYLLNAPANRMSASEAAPDEFLEFARQRWPRVSGEDFLPRELYGDYLQEALRSARLSAPWNVCLDYWRGEVVDVRRMHRERQLRVQLRDGRELIADDVVLAMGNPQPAHIPEAENVAGHPAYARDPWNELSRFSRGEQVLLIGAGLTAVDVIAAASADQTGAPALHVLSRRGFIPADHSSRRFAASCGGYAAESLAGVASMREIVRSVRKLAMQAERRGGDWREVVTAVRGAAPGIWSRLSQHDRRTFLRHVRPIWDVHRHRLPSRVSRQIEALRMQGRLHVHAGRIARMSPRGERIEVEWRPRGKHSTCLHVFDRIVNCTGPDYAIARSEEPLWRNLLRAGLVAPDPLELGLRTGSDGAVIDRSGRPARNLFYVGPMLRAACWEATAVLELRAHAQQTARVLIDRGDEDLAEIPHPDSMCGAQSG